MRLTGIFTALVFLASSSFAQSVEIEETIGNQLEAFNARDVDNAWQYAAPNIQGMFRNSQNFGVMVQRGYPMVWTNRDVQFLELYDRGGVQIQRLLLRDELGEFHMLEYQMVLTSEGWRIAGVQLLPLPDVGA